MSFLFWFQGFFLNVCTDTAKYVAKSASESGKRLVFDLGAPRVVRGQAATVKTLIPFTDVIFGNDTEFTALGEILGLHVSIFVIFAYYFNTKMVNDIAHVSLIALRGYIWSNFYFLPKKICIYLELMFFKILYW